MNGTETQIIKLTAYESWYRNGGLATYAEVFSKYDEKEIEVELVANRLRDGLLWSAHSPVTVLDIGCGTGRFTVMLLDRICSIRKDCLFEADLVDINPEAFERFRVVASNTETARIIVRRTITAPWRLVAGRDLLPPYSLIVADHVFYGEPLTHELINGVHGLLALEGVAIVCLQTTDSDVYRMREQAGISTNSAEDFAALLKGCAMPVEEVNYESRLYFNPDIPAFWDWFFATSTADQTKRKCVLETFARIDEIGRIYLSNYATVFLIWRGGKNIE